jgi:hypothetical protein
VTIATGISGSVPAFVREMNARAEELGLRDTRYANPIGLDDPTTAARRATSCGWPPSCAATTSSAARPTSRGRR